MLDKTTTKASVIIPSYNSAEYIKEAVDSAIAQTYLDKEIIVVDDGSTDNTKKILEPYIENKKIRYIYQQNKGLSGARNTGIRAAVGEYICFLDSDDKFIPEKIEKQVSALEKNKEYDASYCDLVHFTDTSPRQYFHHEGVHPSGNILPFLLRSQFLNPLSLVVRKKIFEKFGYFDETLRRSEDWDLWLKWAYSGVQFLYIDEILGQYRIRSVGNLSNKTSEPLMKEKNLEIFIKLNKRMSVKERQEYKMDKIIGILRKKLIIAYLLNGQKESALAIENSLIIRMVISIIPKTVWEVFWGFVRKTKHRMLLKKIKYTNG